MVAVPIFSQVARLASWFEDSSVRTNWNNRVTIKPRAFYEPTSEDEICDIVKRETSVRCGGGLHSFNEAMVPRPGGAFIDMKRMNRIQEPVRCADGSITITAQAGCTLKQIGTLLRTMGLALENLPTSSDITLGGAIANGVHGSGLTSPAVLAEQVVGMTIVNSAGEKVTVAKEDLPLYRINMGLLGITTSFTLKVVPDFDLVQADDLITGEEEIIARLEPSRLRREVSAYQSANYLIDFNLDDPSATRMRRSLLVKVTDENRAEIEARHLPRKEDYDLPSKTTQWTLQQGFNAAAAAGTTSLGKKLSRKIRAGFCDPKPPRIGKSSLMYQVWLDLPAHDVSYGVPLDKAQEAFKRVMTELRALGYEAMVPLSLRFLSATDKTLMGMNSGRDAVSFELLTSTATDSWGGALRRDVLLAQVAFERVMAEMGARPHWGKEYDVNPKDRFDASVWQRFADEAKKVGAKFRNAWSAAFTP